MEFLLWGFVAFFVIFFFCALALVSAVVFLFSLFSWEDYKDDEDYLL